MSKLPVSRQSEIVVQQLNNEVLIYDLTIHKAFCLNETAAIVFNACDGETTFDELKRKHIFTDDLIYLALDELKKQNLIEGKYESPFAGMNRRQAIRTVGLATIVILPVISSLIAPTALMAQSGGSNLALNAACTSSSQCASGNCFNNTKCCVPGTTAGAAPGTNLGGAGGSGFCSTPGAANNTCTSVRGSLCCSGTAIATACFDSAPGPNFGTYSVSCQCS